jgi:hypothetical protein
MVKNQSGKPSCYDVGHFVEEPAEPFFSCTCVFQVLPWMFYTPRYFIWIPHLFHHIPCPSCKSAKQRMSNGGVVYLWVLSFPRMPHHIIDLDSHIYIIGLWYYCGHELCGKTYQSWSQSILDIIPPSLTSQVPFHLTYQSGLTDQMAAIVRSSFGCGLGPAPFADMI